MNEDTNTAPTNDPDEADEADEADWDPSEEEEGVICPKCLHANSSAEAFCADCGAPIGLVSAIDPIQSILAEGYVYRSAIEGPPRLIILIGMWLIFAPMVALAVVMLMIDGLRPLSYPDFAIAFLGIASVAILYHTTRNYVLKSRLPKEADI